MRFPCFGPRLKCPPAAGRTVLQPPPRLGFTGLDDAVETIRSDIDPRLRWLSFMKNTLSSLPAQPEISNSIQEIEKLTCRYNIVKSWITQNKESFLAIC